MHTPIRHILIIADNYPTEKDPTFSFVAQLAEAIVRSGINITVIAPQNMIKYIMGGNTRHPKMRTMTFGNNTLTILQPCCISFSQYTPKINFLSRRRAIEKCFDRLHSKPDVCYGHFWHSGYYIYRKACKYNIPLIVATGESEISFKADTEIKKQFCKYVSGVVCVSSKNKNESLAKGLTTDEKCAIIPNAIDNNLFKPLHKQLCRDSLGLNDNDFVVAFVGWFNERKGSLRVSNAIQKLNKSNIKSIFIGTGSMEYEPQCDNIIFKGRLPHADIPKYLNSADVFVLPTQKEGCCNAVIEAMACGLPIISSDRDFNYDVLDNSNSILIDPNDVDSIAAAISKLYNEPDTRSTLANNSAQKALELTIEKRAQSIIDFIKTKI